MGVIVPTSMDNVEHNGAPIIRFLSFEILAVVLQLLSIVFNGAILCTLCRRSLLKYPSNRFVFSLCLSHLVVSFLSVSISFVTAFLPTSPSRLHHELESSNVRTQQHQEAFTGNGIAQSLGIPPISHPCSDGRGVDLAHLIMMHLNFGVAVCTSITVALISAERYITIARPMRYKSIVTARRSLYAIICCWLLVALITTMPLVFFENRSPLCGTFSVPMESLAKYFGVVFAVVTIFALAVMIVCYTHIFRIAKAKCQKVQIGHFTASTVSSISSDWPSSATYSSVQGQNRFLHSGSRIESSNSLLHWVLMTNLGKHALPLRVPSALRGGIPVAPPATPTLPPKNAFFSESALHNRRESDETATTGVSGTIRNGSASSSHSSNAGNACFIDPSRSMYHQYHHLSGHRKLRNRWKAYLQPNYNSPRKTIFTIVLLIGAVLFTQLPLSFVLFTSTVETTQRWFQFCTTVLFSTSSVANPVLYGFLNRSIRDQLWRLLRKSRGSEHIPSASSIRKRKRGQHHQQLEEMTNNSKGFLSSANHRHLRSLCRGGMEIPTIKISRKESISSDDNSSVHSIASTNSINAIGSSSTLTVNGGLNGGGAKGKITQVQNRVAASPYYRSVLLKKAYANSSNSLLPRLALPDMSIRRNSSGSIASRSGTNMNGVISKKKGKVNDSDMKLSTTTDEYDTKIQTNQTEGQVEPRQSLEMQTFRNYSTPDLSSPSTSAKSGPSESTATQTQLQEETTKDSSLQIESTEIKCDGQLEEESKKQCLSVERLSPTDDSITRECDSDLAFQSAVNKQGHPGFSESVIPEVPQNTSCNYKRNDSSKPMDENAVGIGIDDDNMLPDNFPRKPSQDSGADMAFSDEEDELPPPATCRLVDSCGHHHHLDHTSPPLLFPAASMHSLPAVLRTLKPLEGDDNKTSASCVSLVGPFVLIKHSNDAESTRADVLLLPCPCSRNDNSSLQNRNYDGEENGCANKIGNNVTVTITGSNSDTQLFNPEICNSNKSLLQVHKNAHNRGYFIRLHDQQHSRCAERECKAHHNHKSKSESDICGMEKRRQSSHYDDTNDNEMKVRSNCYINLVVDPSSNGKNDVHHNTMESTSRFKVYASCCEGCCKENRKNHGCSEIPRSSCSLRVNQEHVRVMPTSYSSEEIYHHLLNANLSQKSSPSGSTVCPLSHSPQWLSVMSVHSSCSSLSSTCPLRILDGHNKSDASDYDDFEDHIET